MGAQLCKDTQRNQQNQLRQLSSKQKTTLNCCMTPPIRSSKLKDQQIAPIEFSDLGTPDNTPDKNKLQKDNSYNTNVSASHPNVIPTMEQDSDQKNKQWKTAVNTQQKQYFHDKNDQQRVINSPNLKQINVELSQFESMPVPYSVIRLVMKPQFLKLIKLVDRDFEKAHGDHKCETFHTWKLHNKGYYFNKLSNGEAIVITNQQFYQGKLMNEFSKADGQGGILIDQLGAYHGTFKSGKAHGNGGYLSVNGKKKCQGLWDQGKLLKGIIQTDSYKYDGDLESSLPHGRGILHLFNKRITYKGQFKNGKYDSTMAQYQCELYRYKGGFKNGKKNGKGQLIEKQRLANKEQSSLKFKAPRKFRGTFKDDVITLQEKYK